MQAKILNSFVLLLNKMTMKLKYDVQSGLSEISGKKPLKNVPSEVTIEI